MRHEPSWWMFACRGAIELALGAFILAAPALTFFSLAVIIGLFAAIAGAMAVGAGLLYRSRDSHWWVSVLLGLASIGIGVVALMHPDPTSVVLLLIIAAHALAAGALDMVLGVRLFRALRGAWTLLAAGIAGIAFGLFAFWYIDPEAWITLLRITGAYAAVAGALHLAAAIFMKRNAARRSHDLSHGARA